MADERPHPTAIESRLNDVRDKCRNEQQKAFFLTEALRLASSNLTEVLDDSKRLINESRKLRQKAQQHRVKRRAA